MFSRNVINSLRAKTRRFLNEWKIERTRFHLFKWVKCQITQISPSTPSTSPIYNSSQLNLNLYSSSRWWWLIRRVEIKCFLNTQKLICEKIFNWEHNIIVGSRNENNENRELNTVESSIEHWGVRKNLLFPSLMFIFRLNYIEWSQRIK